MSRPATIVVLLAAAGLPAGCGWVQNFKHDRVSFTDRCTDVMRTAIPFYNIDIDKATAENNGIRTITARIEATRTDGSKDQPIDRALAVECRFDDNVLTAFRWTKGGPPPAGLSR